MKDGQPVTAILDAYPDWEIPSRVRTIIPTADRQKATVKVRISFLKLDPRILPDMGIKVTFLGAEPEKKPGAEAALKFRSCRKAPSGTTTARKSSSLVKNDRIERRAITVGNNHGSDAEIVAGLVVGDTVVTKGPTGSA